MTDDRGQTHNAGSTGGNGAATQPAATGWILATDLDGTFLGGDETDRLELYHFLKTHSEDVVLVFVSGRDIPFIQRIIETPGMPRPDYIIGDVGTTIVDGTDFKPVAQVQDWVDGIWGGANERIRKLLQNEPGLELQPGEFDRRVSYYFEPELLKDSARQKVEQAGFDVIQSAEMYFDVMPKGVSKGPALLKLIDAMGWDRDRVMVAGDTLNDLSMFETGLKGVAVGNSEAKLVAMLDRLPNTYLSRAPGCAGIADAARHFGFSPVPPLLSEDGSAKKADQTIAEPPAAAPAASVQDTAQSNAQLTKVEPKKSDLVIVYHRQPYEEVTVDGKTEYRENKSPNGIVPTLKSFFGTVSRGAWVAWKQVSPKQQKSFERQITITDSYGTYNVSRLPLTSEQVKQFYQVTSKEALWPILHSFPERFNIEPVDWENFREVNWLFAQAAAEEAADDALIWVHDYNLWLCPAYIRQFKPDAKISFFHHTPFPSPDIFSILPWREEILDSLLSCDIVGFHIPRYAQNFAYLARSYRGVEVTETTPVEKSLTPIGTPLAEPEIITQIRHNGRLVNIDAFPVGTNTKFIESRLSDEDSQQRFKEIKDEIGDMRLILSLGRVDYTKGTREMLQAYERLLERRPELQGKVKLMVVTAAANQHMQAYRQTQSQIEQMAGRINGKYATLSWGPLKLFTNPIPFEEVICYFKAADVCWTTPLRDGLNLVAKEYVAAHKGTGGVLVLSEFTGVAAELQDAVPTNPYSWRSMDAAIDQALDMPREEQKVRMARMYENIHKYNIDHWAQHTLTQFARLEGQPKPPTPQNNAYTNWVAE